MKKLLMFLFISIGMLQYANAQTVTGIITGSDDGEPLPGVNIQIKGTTTGTITDLEGKYTIEVSGEAPVLLFSFIGYTPKEVAVNGQTTIDVQLEVETTGIDEIIVVGYGTQKITKVSGAISTVKAEDIENQKVVRVEEALQGRASGVAVIQNGSPGSKPTVLIRGIPSFSGTDPVVIVDGVPQTLDDLNAINSSDIASLNVLKDAAATAIYGVKGGNGVIVVTTKSGKKNQKPEISFNSYFGEQQVMKKIGVLNAAEYGAILNEGSVTAGGEPIFQDLSALGVGTDWQDQIFFKAPIFSQNLSVRGGSEKVTYFLSAGYLTQDGIVGGGDKSNFRRANVTANLSFNISEKLRFILNTNYANIKGKTVLEDGFNSIIGCALNYDPTVPVLNRDPNTIGKYGWSEIQKREVFNPLTRLENTYNENSGNKIFGKGELQYDILKDLTLTSRLGYVKWDQVGKDFTPLAFYGTGVEENTMNGDGSTVYSENEDGFRDYRHNSVREYGRGNFSFTFETFANYNLKLQEDHNFDFIIGFSMGKSTGTGFDVTRQDVPFNSWDYADITSATGINTVTTPAYINGDGDLVQANVNYAGYNGSTFQNITKRNLSYFGRVNYDYKDKYLVSFSARRDGSTSFGAKNKFANFFAGSLGWIVTEEDFFNVEFINFLKIRGSYGTVGNDNVDPQYVRITTGGVNAPSFNNNGYTFGSAFTPGSSVGTFKNETLKWEKQAQLNAGFDITVLNNKLTLSVDYYQKNVDNLLFADAASLYAGTSSAVMANIGSTETCGIDLELGYRDELFEGFKINTSVTLTTVDSKVTETNSDGTAVRVGGSFYNGTSVDATRFQKGFAPGYFYGYKTDGLFQTYEEIAASPKQEGALPGDIKFVDVDHDGEITALDRTEIGNPFAEYFIGWNLGLEFKNFYFNVSTVGSVGNDVVRAYERNSAYTNKFRSVLGRWTGPGTTNDANTPRYSLEDANSNTRFSDRYVEDGSFVKIKNVTLGYTVPPALYKNKVFTKLSVYIQVKNLFTFTKYSGFDPEVPGGALSDGAPGQVMNAGIDRGAYPQARTFAIGIDMKF